MCIHLICTAYSLFLVLVRVAVKVRLMTIVPFELSFAFDSF